MLHSWKEISSYLNCSVRSCHRWEEELGLPVHRLDGTPKARVFAYAEELDHWLQDKLNHLKAEEEQEAVSRDLGRKRFLLAGVGLAALAAAALGAALLWPLLAPAPVPLMPHNPSLAVLPFDNPMNDAGLEPWRTALSDLIVTDLRQSRYVNVVKFTGLPRLLSELKLAEAGSFNDVAVKAVAEKAGVDFVATGSLVREGQDVVLSVLVHRPEGKDAAKPLRASFRDEKEVFSAADGLTKQIKLALDLTPRHVSRDIDRAVAGISTASPQAFKLYSQGRRALHLNKSLESIALFRRAAELDPRFALAYSYLSWPCDNLGRMDEAKTYARKAIDLAGRLGERERDEFEYDYFGRYDKDPAKARAALMRWWRYYPQDRFAAEDVLEIYIGLEDWDKALGVAEAAWGANPTVGTILTWLVTSYLNVGWGDKAVKLLDDYIEANRGNPYLWIPKKYRARCYLLLGRPDEALAEAEGLVTERPRDPEMLLFKGRVHFMRQEFPAAAAEFQKVFGGDDPYYQTEALLLLRDLCLMQGRVEEAKGYLKRGLEIANKVDSSKASISFLQKKTALHQELSYVYQISGRLEDALKEIDEAGRCYEQANLETPPFFYLHQKALVLQHGQALRDRAPGDAEILGDGDGQVAVTVGAGQITQHQHVDRQQTMARGIVAHALVDQSAQPFQQRC